MAARAERDRRLLAPLNLEQMTEKDEAQLIRVMGLARIRSAQVFGREDIERLDALHRHLARRRLRVLPGGREGGA